MKAKQLQTAIGSAAGEHQLANERQADGPIREQVVSKPAYSVSPNKGTRGSAIKRPMAGMIQSTLDSSRKSRPTSSLRTTEDFSQLSNMSRMFYVLYYMICQ